MWFLFHIPYDNPLHVDNFVNLSVNKTFRESTGGESVSMKPEYPNSLKTFGLLALQYLVFGGLVYGSFVVLLAAYELLTGPGPVLSEASVQRGLDAAADGVFLIRDAWFYLLDRPLALLGGVLVAYGAHLVTRLEDQPTAYHYNGRPRWQYLLVAAAVCTVAVIVGAGPVSLSFNRAYVATSFLYAVGALYTASCVGYTMIDDVVNHGMEFAPWKRALLDYVLRGSLVVILFDAIFGILSRAGVLQVGLRLVPPTLAVAYIGYTVLVDDSRSELPFDRINTRKDRSHAVVGDSDGRSATSETGDDEAGTKYRPQPSPDQDFSDVVGMADLKARLRKEVIEPLRNPEAYEEYDLGTVNGVLLHGPPGTGKTYVSKSLAGELDYNYIPVTPSEITSKYVGEAAQNVQALFDTARENQPCVLFIDELDAIAGDRDGDMTSSERGMVNQLLEELSELNEANADVVVVAATNLIEEIDDAITRPGRFDTTVEVPNPDADARVEILKHHLSRRGIETVDIDWEAVRTATKGYAASNITLISENIAREMVHSEREAVDHELLLATIEDTRGKGPTGASARYLSPPPDEDLSSVAGMDELVETLHEKVIRPLSDTEDFEAYGLSTVNGVLLYGPPGTGKTLLSRAVAGELEYNYIDISPSDILSKYVGEASESIGELFTVARDNQPCVVFFDEIDAIAPSRDTNMNQSQRQMVNQLLQELEAIQGEDVVVFAATNMLDRVDDAVKRSKRFDEQIEVPAPDEETRVAILEHYLDDRPAAVDGVDWEYVATETAGYTGSDIELVADEAGRNALKRSRSGADRSAITGEDVMQAVEETSSSVETPADD